MSKYSILANSVEQFCKKSVDIFVIWTYFGRNEWEGEQREQVAFLQI
jgi:hypothetical protein